MQTPEASPYLGNSYYQDDLWQSDPMHIASESVKAILDAMEEGNKSHMAKRCGLPQPTISRIARGAVVPSLDVLDAVAKAYGFEVWQLLVKGFDPKRPPCIRFLNGAEEALYLKFKQLRSEISELNHS